MAVLPMYCATMSVYASVCVCVCASVCPGGCYVYILYMLVPVNAAGRGIKTGKN